MLWLVVYTEFISQSKRFQPLSDSAAAADLYHWDRKGIEQAGLNDINSLVLVQLMIRPGIDGPGQAIYL